MSDRKKAIERLRAVELAAGMSSHEMLSAIGRAVLPDAVAWVPYSCDGLRNEIVELLEDADAEVDAVRHECDERIARVVEGETCEMVRKHYEGWDNTEDAPVDWDAFECQSCGTKTSHCVYVEWDIRIAPNFCPSCGRKIVKFRKDKR